MPRIYVEWIANRTARQRADLATRLTAAMAAVAKVPPETVTVVFHEVDPRHQATGGVFWTEILKKKKAARARARRRRS